MELSSAFLRTETVAAYDTYPERFDEEFESHMRRYNTGHAEAFMAAVARGSVLDIGSGPGNYAAVFAAKGFDVLCGDPSSAMVSLCRSKGLCAEPMDLTTFDLGRRFDGIWANASLLHLPKKEVPEALERIARHLLPGAVFACAVKEGEGEALLADNDYPGTRRFYSYFSDQEFRALLAPRFEVFGHERTVSRTGRTIFLKYLARPRAA